MCVFVCGSNLIAFASFNFFAGMLGRRQALDSSTTTGRGCTREGNPEDAARRR